VSGLRTAAAILAGGRARRFGGIDKSRLVVLGRPIIVRQVALLQTVVNDVFVVGPDDGRFADLDLRVEADRLAGAGVMGGVYTALDAAEANVVIVVACDMPFLEATVLRQLLALAEGHDGAWARSARGVEPLMACYRRDARLAILESIKAGDLRLGNLGQRLRMAELDLTGQGDRWLVNINSADDYARVQ
jgi:molybdopterin-guanine dinucleotide biosynthesis protein A